ncbi:MAG: proton-conducting transporter membrane subunit [Gammaproteobacteria bacterium]|nr:proton-conducting transporter membrane subunit [Gammaproteobacteria bacterium]
MLTLLIPGLLFVPLACAVVSVLLGFRLAGCVARVGAPLQLALSVALCLAVAGQGGGLYVLGGWEPPLGIALRVDGLAVTLVLVTAVVAAACGLHAVVYLGVDGEGPRPFWPLFWFLWAGLNGVWLAGDLFNAYVALELITLSAVGLVALGGGADALRAALRYLFAALLGSLAYLLGVALLYGSYGTLSLAGISALATEGGPERLALALMLAGLAIKTALFPLHGWLPPAHSTARAPVSALLSALVIKASFYLMARLWLDLGGVLGSAALAQFLGAAGAAAIVWGSWMAWRQTRLKMLIAYSSIAQVGYLFLLFPLVFEAADAAAQQARQGVTLHLVSHALAKAAMFLAAGNLLLAVGDGRVAALAGISRHLPVSLFSFGLAAVSVMGLPPSGGFAGKWLLLQGSLASGQWWWALFVLAGGLMAAAYVFRVFAASYVESAGSDRFRSPPLVLEVTPMVLALAALGLGLVAGGPLVWLAGLSPEAMSP